MPIQANDDHTRWRCAHGGDDFRAWLPSPGGCGAPGLTAPA